MKKKLNKISFIILALLLSSGIMYSQTNFWEPTNTPSRISHAATSNGDLWGGSLEGLLLSTNNGDTWVRKNNGLPPIPHPYNGVNDRWSAPRLLTINPVNGYMFGAVFFHDSSLFVGNDILFKSTDNGESWKAIDINFEDIMGGLLILAILVAPPDEIYIAYYGSAPGGPIMVGIDVGIAKSGILYSSDNGNTWIKKNHNGLPDPWVNCLGMGNDGTLYISSNYGIYRSTDGGDNWLPPSNYTRGAANNIISTPDGSIFAAAGIVLKSTNKGVTWNEIHSGIEYNTVYPSSISVVKIVYNPITEHLVIVDKFNGLFRSSDLGTTWHRIHNGLPTMKIRPPQSPAWELEQSYNIPTSLIVNPKTGMLFVGYDLYTDNECKSRLYRSTINLHGNNTNQPVSIDKPKEIPTTYSISQNYPNPFNPSTNFTYSLPNRADVTIAIYDLFGREINTLVNESKEAGTYNITWNGRDNQNRQVATGVYFYKMQTAGFEKTTKMMLVK